MDLNLKNGSEVVIPDKRKLVKVYLKLSVSTGGQKMIILFIRSE